MSILGIYFKTIVFLADKMVLKVRAGHLIIGRYLHVVCNARAPQQTDCVKIILLSPSAAFDRIDPLFFLGILSLLTGYLFLDSVSTF
jgi:hypothetical protein